MSVPAGYWPCACVRRDRQGNMRAIKFHAPKVRRCAVCKCERPDDFVAEELRKADNSVRKVP
jgi:hypothetical protein